VTGNISPGSVWHADESYLGFSENDVAGVSISAGEKNTLPPEKARYGEILARLKLR
jgi:hypothetical protein